MTSTSDEHSSAAHAAGGRGVFATLLRFVGWICIVIGVFALLSTVYVYAPCFLGTPGTCISGLLLFSGALSLAFCGAGLLLLMLTRRRPRAPG